MKGDVKCLHCGFVSGEWVGAKGAPIHMGGLRGAGPGAVGDPEVAVRCFRCDGPVFLEGAGPVVNSQRLRRIQRLREQLAALGGRPSHAA